MQTTQPLRSILRAGERFPRGFRIGGVASGVKADSALDLALLMSTEPCTAAGVFTRNAFAAAPVIISRDMLSSNSLDAVKRVSGVLVNAGCANACTGPEGLYRATLLQREVERLGKMGKDAGCLLMSTGVIGQQLSTVAIQLALPDLLAQLSDSAESLEIAAKAIMTTDNFPKMALQTSPALLDGSPNYGRMQFSMAGIAKGAGLVHPQLVLARPSNQGTVLALLFTDAHVTPDILRTALHDTVDCTFNAISVDGDTSTNDTVLLLANGACGAGKAINNIHTKEYAVFRDMLHSILSKLSEDIVRDGEGATKLVTISIKGAPTRDVAHTVASAVAKSISVKASFFGEDLNWGRVVCAIGNAPLPRKYSIDPARVHLYLATDKYSRGAKREGYHHRLHLIRHGVPFEIDQHHAKEIMDQSVFELQIDLGMGNEIASYKTCDLGHGYININATSRT